MTCRACELVQNKPRPSTHFYRWKGTLIEIVACFHHAREVINVLDDAQKQFVADTAKAPRA